jgi:hypothetical protein
MDSSHFAYLTQLAICILFLRILSSNSLRRLRWCSASSSGSVIRTFGGGGTVLF